MSKNNYVTVNFSEFGKNSNWSADYQVNKNKGLKPFKKGKGGKLEEVDETKSIPKDAIYMKKSDVDKINKLKDKIIILTDEYNNLFDETLNKYK